MEQRLASLAFHTSYADWDAAQSHSQLRAPSTSSEDRWTLVIVLGLTALPVLAASFAGVGIGAFFGGMLFILVYAVLLGPPLPARQPATALGDAPLVPILMELFPDFLVCARGEHRYLFANWSLHELLEGEGRFLVSFATWKESLITLPIPLAVFERADEVRTLLDGLRQRAAHAVETGRRSLALDDARARDDIKARITFELTVGDLDRAERRDFRRPGGNRLLSGPLWTIALVLAAAFCWFLALAVPGKPEEHNVFAAIATLWSSWILHNGLIAWQVYRAPVEPARSYEVGLTSRAVLLNNGECAVRESWLYITEIAYLDDFIAFRQRDLVLVYIPLSAFPTSGAAASFLGMAQYLWRQAQPTDAIEATLAPTVEVEVPTRLRPIAETGNPYQTPWADL